MTNPVGMPFNSIDKANIGGKTIALMTPNTAGLTSNNYGSKVVIKDGSFVIPPIATAGSLLRFSSEVGGLMDIGVVARTDAASGSQMLGFQLLDGPTVLSTGSITINGAYQYYSLANNAREDC